jgi:hypothetical protein
MAKRNRTKHYIDSKRMSNTNPIKNMEWLRWFISKPEVKIAIFINIFGIYFPTANDNFKKLEENKIP